MIQPRAHVATLAPVPHGSITDAELARLGLGRDQVVDFSTNTNPLGPSPAAVAAARAAVWTHYPDDGATRLRQAIAEREGSAPEGVVVGNGSAELIWLVALAFLDPGQSAVVVGPTFGEYARAVRVAGGVVREARARGEDGFRPDLAALGVGAGSARLLFVCDPNNPTGLLLGAEALARLAGARPETLVVVDEAYRPFVDDPPAWPAIPGNVVLLRSMTKDGALPGLRLGYALAAPPVARALEAVRPPWSVNAVAQAAGLAALADRAHVARARDEVRRARAYVTAELTRLGLRVFPSAANFLLVEVGDGAAMRAALLRHGLVVRDCASFGLPAHVRIGLRALPECQRLIEAFGRL
ncbi:MAG TPA: histidinol-phosphate transaminase [Chloroflexota bacterium]|jgi:L-threonine-O-3-phosphate decarboxylase|nr:histidinol-phosphate transaminase [Chloroflexota bacterium]